MLQDKCAFGAYAPFFSRKKNYSRWPENLTQKIYFSTKRRKDAEIFLNTEGTK